MKLDGHQAFLENFTRFYKGLNLKPLKIKSEIDQNLEFTDKPINLFFEDNQYKKNWYYGQINNEKQPEGFGYLIKVIESKKDKTSEYVNYTRDFKSEPTIIDSESNTQSEFEAKNLENNLNNTETNETILSKNSPNNSNYNKNCYPIICYQYGNFKNSFLTYGTKFTKKFSVIGNFKQNELTKKLIVFGDEVILNFENKYMFRGIVSEGKLIKGKMILKDENVKKIYEGEFYKDDQKNIQSKFFIKKLEFYLAKYHGKGKLVIKRLICNTYDNGNETVENEEHSEYIGEFLKGEYHGNGVLIDNNRQVKMEGKFRNGKFYDGDRTNLESEKVISYKKGKSLKTNK